MFNQRTLDHGITCQRADLSRTSSLGRIYCGLVSNLLTVKSTNTT